MNYWPFRNTLSDLRIYGFIDDRELDLVILRYGIFQNKKYDIYPIIDRYGKDRRRKSYYALGLRYKISRQHAFRLVHDVLDKMNWYLHRNKTSIYVTDKQNQMSNT